MKPSSPFYKNPTLWLIVLLPLSTVIVGVTFIIFSVTGYDGVVEDDYYKKGKQINLVIERDIKASELGLSARLDFERSKNLVKVRLQTNQALEFPETLALKLIHRTVANQDIKLQLHRQTQGDYLAVLPEMLKTAWQLELGTPEWRLAGRMAGVDSTQALLEPNNR